MAPNYKFFHDCYRPGEVAVNAFIGILESFGAATWRGYRIDDVMKHRNADQHWFIYKGGLYAVYNANGLSSRELVDGGHAWVPWGYTRPLDPQEAAEQGLRARGLRRPSER